jgi:hypothetical protein
VNLCTQPHKEQFHRALTCVVNVVMHSHPVAVNGCVRRPMLWPVKPRVLSACSSFSDETIILNICENFIGKFYNLSIYQNTNYYHNLQALFVECGQVFH